MAASAVIKNLHLRDKKIPIGCVGSIFKAGELLTGLMLKIIRQFAPKAFLTESKLIPAKAAARIAFENFHNGVKK